jgi:hypothetical protein
MARKLTLSTIGLISLAAISGCQPKQSMVDALPAPNFNGPVISAPPAAAPAPAPRPLAQAPKVASATPLQSEKGWIPPVAPRAWKWIVVHHSASPAGNAARFDQEHRSTKGWDELGYDFVIGNGTDSGDGQVEVGPRWTKQKWGAHAKTPDNRFNDYGIGICLVGNFDIERPTVKQMESLSRLVAFLQARYRIAPDKIIGHGNVNAIAHGGTITNCPGRNLNVAVVRQMASRRLADAGQQISDAQTASTSELLLDISELATVDPGN